MVALGALETKFVQGYACLGMGVTVFSLVRLHEQTQRFSREIKEMHQFRILLLQTAKQLTTYRETFKNSFLGLFLSPQAAKIE